MFDKNRFVAACEALDMEKPAAAAPAAAKGLGGLWRSLPGWGRALAIAGPAAAGGAMAGGGTNRDQIASLLQELNTSKQRRADYETGEFSPFEHRMFTRHGLDPQRLRFIKTLANFMSGMGLENRLYSEALGGRQASMPAAGKEQLAVYA